MQHVAEAALQWNEVSKRLLAGAHTPRGTWEMAELDLTLGARMGFLQGSWVSHPSVVIDLNESLVIVVRHGWASYNFKV